MPARARSVLAACAWLLAGAVACGGHSAEHAPANQAGMGALAATAGDAGKAATGGTTNGGSGGRNMGAQSGSGGMLAGNAGAAAGGGGTGARGGMGGVGPGGAGGLAAAGSSNAAGSSGRDGGGGVSGMSGAAGASAAAGMGGVIGLPPLGPELTDVTKLTPKSCSITPTVTLAADMALVGVASFTTDFGDAERAIIQFGKTSDYTLEAPVNWAAPSHKTWLLGMPANTTVHYRVVVIEGGSACISDDATYETGALPDGAPPNVTRQAGTSTAPAAPGFIIAGKYTGAGADFFAYIVNAEGEVVWAHRFPVLPVRALMSWDGMYMYARDLGATVGATDTSIYRVAMDGSGETLLPVPGGAHHDLVAIPTGFAYIARTAENACDHIFTAEPDGSNAKSLVDLDAVFSHFAYGGGTFTFDRCHVNAIRYYRDDDTYSVSDREKDAIAFVSGTGTILGSVGAVPTSDTPNHANAEGADSAPDSLWRVQHGHDLYAPNKLVLWSNGIYSDGTSHVLHYTITGATAQLDWQYTGAGTSPTTCDAQHLANGNFLVTNSRTGDAHELDATGKLVRSFAGLSSGYSCQRSTLYGPPPGR